MTDDLVARLRSYADTCTGLEPRRIITEAADHIAGTGKLVARIEALEGAVKQAHDLLMCVEQTSNNIWWVNAFDPEVAVCDTFSALESVLPAALAKDKSDG